MHSFRVGSRPVINTMTAACARILATTGPMILEPSKNATARGLELLLSILSPDEIEAEDYYETLRLKTLRFFQWKGAADADDLANETLLRVARKLGEGAPVARADLGSYVRGVARMVFLEAIRNEDRDRKLRQSASDIDIRGTDVEYERRIGCLEKCLAKLEADGRELILAYYSDSGEGKIPERKKLATSLGISMTALRIRAYRLRERLADMVGQCLDEAAA